MKKFELSPLFAQIDAQLRSIYPDEQLCRQYAWWLLEAITNIKKSQLVTMQSLELSPDEENKLTSWMHKLVHEHMPMQYLLGSVPFNGVDILVEPPILIPRPETEEWCINLIEQLRALNNKQISILDLCSGSGCIALAFAHHLRKAQIVGADISPKAIELSTKNAAHNNLHNITFMQSDLFSSIPKEQKFDLIVSNPPYIAPQEWDTLDLSVKNWEDKDALIAADDGLAIIKKIIAQAPEHLRSNAEFEQRSIPQLVLEIDYNQSARVTKLMHESGFINIVTLQDLEGKDRIVCGSKRYVADTKNS